MSEWPIQIEVPNKIGTGSYYYDNHKPCCAVGWCRYELSKVNNYLPYKLIDEWRQSYIFISKKLSHSFSTMFGVETTNDKCGPEERKLLYLLTWAKLGYTRGMPKTVTKILKAINNGRTFNSVEEAITWAETKPRRRKKA